MSCDSRGGEAIVKFDGVGVVLMGPLTQAGGRADVYVDGKKAGVLEAYIVPNTHDNALWHVFGLKPRIHSIRIVMREDADPRSQGHKITIDRAVAYRAPQP